MASRQVAIAGFGPRGLGALERLIAHQRMLDAPAIEVTIFEPHPVPGAGPAYDPAQPEYRLMNFPAAKIDLNWKAGGPPSALDAGSFTDWAGADAGRAEHWYPPRALVGRYLAAAATELIDSAPFPVELVPEPVTEMHPADRGWRVDSRSRSSRFDEVLLAVGHAAPESGGRRSPFVAEAGSPVGIRGFGLTAIDLILELTEGRGGRFEAGEGSSLHYVKAGAEPSAMIPRSRHGRAMLVKPELDQSPAPPDTLPAIIARSRDEVLRLPAGCGAERLSEEVAALAAALLANEGAGASAAIWARSACAGRLEPASDPAGAIAESLRIAYGEAAAGLEWALGLAWRSVYPAVVERFSHGGLPEGEYAPFRRMAAELERLAFGPPPVNGAKLLALADAGILDLAHLAATNGVPNGIELDAVAGRPGLQLRQRPLDGLAAAGAIRVPPGARGIEVTRSARCVGAGGRVTPGLAAVGRLTEDWVIGNDTLNRDLHPEIGGWAETVCEAARTEPEAAVTS